jgi:hypothetical protein
MFRMKWLHQPVSRGDVVTAVALCLAFTTVAVFWGEAAMMSAWRAVALAAVLYAAAITLLRLRRAVPAERIGAAWALLAWLALLAALATGFLPDQWVGRPALWLTALGFSIFAFFRSRRSPPSNLA